jgi:hypothetical protein
MGWVSYSSSSIVHNFVAVLLAKPGGLGQHCPFYMALSSRLTLNDLDNAAAQSATAEDVQWQLHRD